MKRLQRRKEITVRYLVDPDGGRAARFLNQFPGSQWRRSIEECVDDGGFEIAFVASPPSLHLEHIRGALRAGGHVLSEKPLTTTADAAHTLAREAKAVGRVLAVGQTRRFTRSLATAADLCRQKRLGHTLSFELREGGAWRWPIASLAPFLRDMAGGGVLTDKGVHVLDSLFWMFGPLAVTSYADDALAGSVENNCRLTLEGNGVSGVVHLSWDQSLNNEIHIRGSNAELRVLSSNNDAVALREGDGEWQWIPNTRTWPAEGAAIAATRSTPRDYEDSVYLEWIDFLRSVHHGGEPAVTAAVAADVIEQIERAYSMATPIAEPALTASEQAVSERRHWRSESR